MSMAPQPPTKEVDVDFLVFVERHATDLLKWDILTFFGHNPDYQGTVSRIAREIGRSSQSIRAELGDLALVGVLDCVQTDGAETVYKLTQNPQFRRMTRKLANSQIAS